MVVPFPGMVDGNDGDTTYIEETDFSIVPKNIRIWPGKFPYAKGMNVLTPDIKESATKIKTYTELYKSNYNDIYSDLFSFKDMVRDTFGYSQILNLNIANPDFEVCTEAWVDLLGSKAPRIDGNDAKKISKVSNLLSNSNFTESFRDLIRGGEIMFGNKVFLIEKLSGGNTKIIDMPLKCWIPFVNSRDTSTIEVNIFFNIYTDSDNKSYCEFISYYENGHVEKVVFEYNKESDTLGDQFGEVEETEAFDNKGVSPIVVGTYNQIDNEIRGRSLYEKWKSSIKSCLFIFKFHSNTPFRIYYVKTGLKVRHKKVVIILKLPLFKYLLTYFSK
jgi:hypothetical protein